MNKTDYNKEFLRIAAQKNGARVLVHACCAPCAATGIDRLLGAFLPDFYFFNPNISDRIERALRQKNLQKLLANAPAKLICAPDGLGEAEFLAAAQNLENQPEGSARCMLCIRLRLEQTAKAALLGGYDYFCTTLTGSANKNSAQVNALGFEVEHKTGAKYLPSDFKKDGGAALSKAYCQKYEIYRQNFCGCEYSRKK